MITHSWGSTGINWSRFMCMWWKWFRIKFLPWFFSVGYSTNMFPSWNSAPFRWDDYSVPTCPSCFCSIWVGTWGRMETSFMMVEGNRHVGAIWFTLYQNDQRWCQSRNRTRIIGYLRHKEFPEFSVGTFARAHFPFSLSATILNGLFRSLIECKLFVQRKWI